jgi:hypothetical protein
MKKNIVYRRSLEIVNYLSRFIEEGGLRDPLEKKVLNNGYGNAFYGLVCSLHYKKTNNLIWKERALKAITAELDIIDKRYYIKKGVFRWEFKNYALINSYILLKDEIDINLRERFRKTVKSWLNLDSYQTNWLAMRALNYRLRYLEFNKKSDLIRSNIDLKLTLNKQTKEGFFPDELGNNSFQYHAYVTALLFQYYRLTEDKTVKSRFLKGVDCISYFIDPKGDFNYFGRGKYQIFGYASLIYALAGAYELTNDSKYLKNAKIVFNYLDRFEGYPIVLGKDESKKEGWYGYNNKSDYLGFAAVYLFYASEILEKEGFKSLRCGGGASGKYSLFFPSLGLYVKRNGNQFLCYSKGGFKYDSSKKADSSIDTSADYYGNKIDLVLYNFSKMIYRGLSLLYKLFFRPRDFILTIEYYKAKKKYYSRDGKLKVNT